MNRVKKTLSIVLALLMVLSVSAYAAVPADSSISISMKTDKTAYAAGDIVNLVVAYEQTESVYSTYGGIGAGEFEICYDSNVFEPVVDVSAGVNFADYTGIDIANYALANAIDTGNSSVTDGFAVGSALPDNAATYSWDSILHLVLVEDAAKTTAQRYIDCSKAAVDMISVPLRVKADAANGDYVVGINGAGFDNYVSFIVAGTEEMPSYSIYVFENDTFGTEKMYDCGTTTIKVGAAGPTVEALGTMARMDDWTAAETTNIFDGGLIGQISNVTLTFTDDKQCNEIESIEVYANGQKMGNAYQVYKVDDTTYQFRAVVKNMDKTADTYATDVEYEFRVTMKGDYADSGVLTATKTVSAQTIFNTAYDNYKGA